MNESGNKSCRFSVGENVNQDGVAAVLDCQEGGVLCLDGLEMGKRAMALARSLLLAGGCSPCNTWT